MGQAAAHENYREAYAPVPLELFCANLQAGDLLFFTGSNLKSRMIKIGTWYEWSHVAIVDECPRTGTRFLWESQMDEDGCVDVLSRSEQKTGVRLTDLWQRLFNYSIVSGTLEPATGTRLLDLAVRKLTTPSPLHRTQFAQAMMRFQEKEKNKAFEQTPSTMLRAAYSDFLGEANPQDTTEYFCSELVVQTLVQCGAVHQIDPNNGQRVNCSNWTPKRLGVDQLPMVDGFRLGKLCEYRVSIPPHQKTS